jgi:hypothetical protein
MNTLPRRDFIHAFASAVALSTMLQSRALASPSHAITQWAQNIADLNRDLSTGKIELTQWQGRIAALHADIDLSDLKKYLDFDRLTSAMQFPSSLAETADPKFPASINVAGTERKWFIRFFGMRKGGAIIPHVHNNMVSAHLVMEGSFHARTFDRKADLAQSVLLKPIRKEVITPGQSVTMSDDRENAHWLIAEQDRSFTFDVGVLSISKTRTYGLKANDYAMIFVDPTGAAESNGLIRAPVISFDECVAKFAA